MLTCKQAVDLASTSLETPLPRWQRWQLGLHLLMCRHCRRYLKQLRFLRQLSVAMKSRIKTIGLSVAARERIAKKLQQQSDAGR